VDVDLRLTEPTVSRLHAVLEMWGDVIIVRDLNSRFGTYVNGMQIRERQLRPTDHVRFGQVITYCLEEEGFRLVAAQSTGLSVRGLEIAVGGRILVAFGNWSWNIPPGHLVGILGPSGVGKTMVLRALAGIRPPSRGVITCGDLPDVWKEIDTYRRRLAFIPQDDVINPLLTVHENIALTAELRLADTLSPRERSRRVTAALELFKLQEHARKLARVLSGGQRKRVSVAMEWLRQPELFLLDEPTAGLDPANEARLMENLVEVARRGATVLCTTHLMENIYLLDSVLVLGAYQGRGAVAYAGPPGELLSTLGCRGFADLYERLERGQFDPLGIPEREPHSGAIQESVPEGVPKASNTVGTRPFILGRVAIQPKQEVDPVALRVVFQRTALSLWRDRWMRWMTVAQPVILAAVVALTQFQAPRVFPLLFFTTVVACWLGMNNSIRDFVRDRRGYIRDRLAGMAPASYLLAKWLFFASLGLVQLAVFLLLVRFFTPFVLPEYLYQELTEQSLPAWWFALWLIYLGGLGLALIVSTIVESEEAAVAWLPILILPQMLFSATSTGVSNLTYRDPRPFRPLLVTIRYPLKAVENGAPLEKTAVVVDVLSLGLVCRPGVLVIEQPQLEGFPRRLWIADLCHLVFIVLGQALVLWLVFLNRERRWPLLVGY
jgi:ABC-type multidrug transport system ATPase subunit